jgi:large subunit ribosomal protein L25
MEILEIEVTPRAQFGKGAAKRLRREGQLPGIFYARGEKAVPVCVDAKEFQTQVSAVRGLHLIRLKSSDSGLVDRVVLLKEVQVHPVSHAVLHADFYQVDLTKKTRVRVPLDFVGKAQGVILGGILQPIEREIEVSCLPMDIPESIPVDVTHMKIGDTLHMSDILMPAGAEAVYEVDSVVAIITAPTVEEVVPTAAPEEVAAQAPEAKKEPEVKEGTPKTT